ncbi:MAG TPA: DUF3105 domain-containing protein [Acidimicrobiales bacterium]|nr:DUF3105 domain-containing protein [Acidimicrobiales bacterium]
MTPPAATALAAALLLLAAACGGDGDANASPSSEASSTSRQVSGGELIGPADEGIEGVEAFEVASRHHTQDDLTYDREPPVGGEHYPVPGTCGFYDVDQGPDEVPPEEFLVHDLEHGAIWIAYDPALPDAARDVIRALVQDQPRVVATPAEDLDTPLVVTAWGRQLALDAVDDERLLAFIDQYRGGGGAPEAGSACAGAGTPAVPAARS